MLFRRTQNEPEGDLPRDLIRAARSLEERFQILRLPAEKSPQAQWDALPGEIRAMIPAWLPALLSNYALAGVWLEFGSFRGDSLARMFAFFGDPDFYAKELLPGWEARDLVEFGFLPFGWEEGSGSWWVASVADGAAGKIYFLERTGWGPGKPAPDNGLHYAHRNLACFLSALAISNANFNGNGFWGGKDV
jgi:hypothetical protein